MKLKNVLLSIATLSILSQTLWADCADKNIAIYAAKMTQLHSALIIPNTNHIFKNDFKDSPYIIINWGSELFYKAGSDQKEQLAAAPAALLMEGPAVVLVEGLKNDIISSEHSVKINISKAELTKLENAILKLVKKNNKEEFLKLATDGDNNTLSEYGGIFYRSSVTYKGLRLTCNGMMGKLLSENTDNFGTFSSYMPGPLMEYLDTKTQDKTTCIESN